MATRQKLTVRLQQEKLDFLKRFARENGLTVTEVLDRYLTRLQEGAATAVHPEVGRISGIVPASLDAEEEYAEAMLEKHG